jgi:glycosyltransferase involved in cell wall biosynthesis
LSEDIKDVYKVNPYIVPNGIEVQSYFERHLESSNSVLQILYLSHYKRSKGILELIEALKILKLQGYNFVARLVGEPLDLSIETLKSIVNEYNLSEQIEIVGPLYGDDKINELKRSDIFVFPTYYEAFGLVILEAMQYSLPIIATCEGSIPDIIVNNETGFMVEKQKPNILAEKIALLLTNDELRKTMGKKGYERFKNNFTLQHFESNLYGTFQKILNTSQAV